MLFVLGIGSNIGMAGCVMTVIRDKFPDFKPWKVAVSIGLVGCSIGFVYTTPVSASTWFNDLFTSFLHTKTGWPIRSYLG